jgi:hypothetical protein
LSTRSAVIDNLITFVVVSSPLQLHGDGYRRYVTAGSAVVALPNQINYLGVQRACTITIKTSYNNPPNTTIQFGVDSK